VIHVTSEQHTLRNTRLARDANVDGVFLINHGMPSKELFSIFRTVAAEHADWWIGLNCLDLKPNEVFKFCDHSVRGVWVDNAMIDESVEVQERAEQVLEAREKAGWFGLYFGGVAFKGQRRVTNFAKAAATAARYMDVVTTSGWGTGHAASPKKIATMKRALGNYPLAIASGITPGNVGEYLAIADCFLVATGISKSFDELDPERVAALVRAIRNVG
jgi:predicted TIM-barrel enzyme